MNKRKLLITVSIAILLSGVIGYNYMYKSHRDISEEKAAFVLTSSELTKEFTADMEASIKKYLDKTIELNGRVTEIEKDNFMLDNTIVCYTDSITITQLIKNKLINVKGRSIGYDELLDLIKLDQVTISNN